MAKKRLLKQLGGRLTKSLIKATKEIGKLETFLKGLSDEERMEFGRAVLDGESLERWGEMGAIAAAIKNKTGAKGIDKQ